MTTTLTVRTMLSLVLTAGLVAGCTNDNGTGDAGEAAKEETMGDAIGEVVTTASGLKYEIVKPGSGASPSLNDRVTVHYRGTLTNGTEFDSSYKRGKPATFPVNGVIKGWTEALQLMKEGATWKLTIPPDLAYGPRGAGGMIGPNETLLFDVELIKVN